MEVRFFIFFSIPLRTHPYPSVLLRTHPYPQLPPKTETKKRLLPCRLTGNSLEKNLCKEISVWRTDNAFWHRADRAFYVLSHGDRGSTYRWT